MVSPEIENKVTHFKKFAKSFSFYPFYLRPYCLFGKLTALFLFLLKLSRLN